MPGLAQTNSVNETRTTIVMPFQFFMVCISIILLDKRPGREVSLGSQNTPLTQTSHGIHQHIKTLE
jgi:hypothetical protein